VLFLKNNLHFLTTKTPSTPRSYEYKELPYSWRSPRLGGKTQDYLLETALALSLSRETVQGFFTSFIMPKGSSSGGAK
jgi:hypothetical protein